VGSCQKLEGFLKNNADEMKSGRSKMKKNMSSLISVLIVVGFLASTASAELGLNQIAAEQGSAAVGQAVLAAVQAVYANNTDPAVIQTMLRTIMNEAQATGNQTAIFNAFQAVMQGAAGQGATAASQAAQTAVSVVYAANNTPEATQTQLSAILSGASSGGTPPAILNVTIQAVMQGAAGQGSTAVGQAAQTAATVVYAVNSTPDVTQNHLSVIISSAAAGGDAAALSGAVVGVLTAGGTPNIGIATAAINNTVVPPNLQQVVTDTVIQTTPLVTDPTPTPPPTPETPTTPPPTPETPTTPPPTPETPTTPPPTPETPPGGSGGGDVGPGTGGGGTPATRT
jgi:hypothetical protein